MIYDRPVQTCSKLRCTARSEVAVAIRYEAREVVFTDLPRRADPGLLQLCLEHADRLTPPLGWRIRDARSLAASRPG